MLYLLLYMHVFIYSVYFLSPLLLPVPNTLINPFIPKALFLIFDFNIFPTEKTILPSLARNFNQ